MLVLLDNRGRLDAGDGGLDPTRMIGCIAIRNCPRSNYELEMTNDARLCGDFDNITWSTTEGLWRCEFKRLYVRKEGRGCGVGRLLVSRAMEVAKELGYKVACLDSQICLSAALALYSSLGFSKCPLYRSYVDTESPAKIQDDLDAEAARLVAMHRLL